MNVSKRIFLGAGLVLAGSYASAATEVTGNGIDWTTSISGIGSTSGTVTLFADMTGPLDFGHNDGAGSITPDHTYELLAVEIRNIGNPDSADFTISNAVTSVGGTWLTSDDTITGGPSGNCSAMTADTQYGCAYWGSGTKIDTDTGNFSITFDVNMRLGTTPITDLFHLKVLWKDVEDGQTGDLISKDLTNVPIPAAAWLFGSGLIGLAGIARKKKA